MERMFTFVPLLWLLIWFGLLIYVIVLATRLVNAVEHIAHSLDRRPPGPPQL